jgi:hypothetical protein
MAFKSDKHRKWYFANKKKGTLPGKERKSHIPLVFHRPDRYGGVSGPLTKQETGFFGL